MIHVPIPGAKRWGRQVYRTGSTIYYIYEIDDPDSNHPGRKTLGIRCYIPRGFKHDFASIPWPLHYVLKPTALGRAPVIHDRLCVDGVPRFLADALFRHIMEQDKIPCYRRIPAYYAVRLYWQILGRWFNGRRK